MILFSSRLRRSLALILGVALMLGGLATSPASSAFWPAMPGGNPVLLECGDWLPLAQVPEAEDLCRPSVQPSLRRQVIQEPHDFRFPRPVPPDPTIGFGLAVARLRPDLVTSDRGRRPLRL